MAVQNNGEGTAPTAFAPEESVLRHGSVHRSAGHRPVEASVEQPDAKGTQHRAAAKAGDVPTGDSMFGRARARLADSREGQ